MQQTNITASVGEIQHLEDWVLENPATHYYSHDTNGYEVFSAGIQHSYLVEVFEEDEFPSYIIYMDKDSDPVAWYSIEQNRGYKPQ